MKLLERNSIINIFLLSSSIYFGITISPFLFLIWPIALITNDIFHYFFGFSAFNSETRIQRSYQFLNTFLSDQSGKGRDLGFGLYDGNLTKTAQQSLIDKWDAMLTELKLSPGDSLIDIGCGYGDWLNYARSKGIKVVGVNLSPDQVKACQDSYNLDVVYTNWKEIPKNQELQNKLYGKFDAVTFMDTVEHYIPSELRHDEEAQNQIYSEMFKMAHNLIQKNSHSKRVFISCLHHTKELKTWRNYLSSYFVDKYYSGSYPFGDDGLTKNIKNYFNEVVRYDRTEDYRITSVLDRKHFGAYKVQWDLKKIFSVILLFIVDPNHIHKWVEAKANGWMKLQFGDRAWDQNFDNKQKHEGQHVTLWWLVLEAIP